MGFKPASSIEISSAGATDDCLDVTGERLITREPIALADDEHGHLSGTNRREQLPERRTLLLIFRATDPVVAQHVEEVVA